MKDKLIKNYINNLKQNDIYNFAIKNNINLTNDEINYLYKLIKNNYQEIIYNDPDNILKDLKQNISEDSFEKIVKLYYIYKEKYQRFL